MTSEERWVPKQVTQPETPDLRNSKLGPKGYKERSKRKREAEMELGVIEPAAGDMEVDGANAASKRRKSGSTTFIPVSGRTWKGQAKPAGKVMKPKTGPSSWEKKMAAKAQRDNYVKQKREILEEKKTVRQAASKQRREARERKEENRKKSEVVQKVSTATVKKMMKNRKQMKMLKKADTN